MPETFKEWGEEEQDDSCSSCSSLLLLESSDDTEIITIGEEGVPSVPGVPSKIDRLFLMERILGSYQLAMERLRLGQEDGGASNPVPQDPQDDVKAQDIQDIQDTQDTQDTQDKH